MTMTKIKALELSVAKWTLYANADILHFQTYNKAFEIECALCVKYINDDELILGKNECAKCPLFIDQGGISCNMTGSIYREWRTAKYYKINKDKELEAARRMLQVLEKLLKREYNKRSKRKRKRETKNSPDSSNGRAIVL